ncbi:hypothetical protein [Paenibacillus herberti]|uniref:hypothetical protein n=1 Tax=Paenibacillus herberti TaxID=1619309 RepID=UPI001595D5EA|nr:hypothetical protein [Paenibacillus herberti]
MTKRPPESRPASCTGGTFRRSFIPYGVRGLSRRGGLARFGEEGRHAAARFPDP